MKIIGIDPGPDKSAYVVYDGHSVLGKNELSNDDMLYFIGCGSKDIIAIEQIRGYGIQAGNQTFDTCEWVGRFEQDSCGRVVKIPRQDVLNYFEIPRKGSDKWLKEKLVDLYPHIFPEAKRNKKGALSVNGWPGSHFFAALAVAVVGMELVRLRNSFPSEQTKQSNE